MDQTVTPGTLSEDAAKVREIAEGMIKHVGYPVAEAWRTARQDVAREREYQRRNGN